jgi:hypothetical protein
MFLCKQLSSNGGTVFPVRFSKQQLNSNRGTVFSVRSMPRCYNYVVRQLTKIRQRSAVQGSEELVGKLVC